MFYALTNRKSNWRKLSLCKRTVVKHSIRQSKHKRAFRPLCTVEVSLFQPPPTFPEWPSGDNPRSKSIAFYVNHFLARNFMAWLQQLYLVAIVWPDPNKRDILPILRSTSKIKFCHNDYLIQKINTESRVTRLHFNLNTCVVHWGQTAACSREITCRWRGSSALAESAVSQCFSGCPSNYLLYLSYSPFSHTWVLCMSFDLQMYPPTFRWSYVFIITSTKEVMLLSVWLSDF